MSAHSTSPKANGWATVHLEDIATIVSGGTPSSAIPSFWDGNIPWCTPTDITGTPGRFLTTTARRITELGLSKSPAQLLPANALLLCTRATVGDLRIAAVPMATNQGFKSLVCRERVDPAFLYYKLLTLKSELVARGSGSTFLEVSKQDVARLEIRLPSLPEQRRIAEVLSSVDELIDALQRLIAKKRAIKQGAMQQLLTGRTRLPGFDGEWVEFSLGEHVQYLRTASNSRADLTTGAGLGYLHYGDIHTSERVFLDARRDPMPALAANLPVTADPLLPGDVVFVDASEDRDGVGKSVELLDVPETGAIAGLHTIAARFDRDVLADGYKARLQFHPDFRTTLLRLAAGTKVLATTRDHISTITMELPPLPEQLAIAKVLNDMDDEIEALDARLAKTRDIKQGMMQELLTGRTRLPVPADAADDQGDTDASPELDRVGVEAAA